MSRKAIFKGCVVLVCLGICGISFGQYGGGSGTEASPYLIYTAEQLNAIGANSGDWAKRFKVMTDIDLSAYKGTQFNRIGTDYDHTFKGVLDGNGHTISNFTYDSNCTDYVGLVGCLRGIVKNLGLINVNVTGYWNVGGLVGKNSFGTVTNCYSSGSVSGYGSIGGLVGDNSDGTVTNCYSFGFVLGTDSIGGLVGFNHYGTVANGYASGSVSGTEDIGGLVGANYGTVINCYSSGPVLGTEFAGGLVGSGAGAVNSFWDIQTSGQTDSAGGRGRTTQQMWQVGTYMGWNSDGQVDWVIDEGKDYPRLVWEKRSGKPIPSHNLSDFLAGSGTADDPYLISTAEQFNSIGRFPSQWGKQYRLVADVNLAGTDATMIGVHSSNAFNGVLDGNGHTISNFTYDSNSMNYIGLVGYLSKGGVVKDLGLVGVHVTGRWFVGGLVGYNISGTVTNCYSSGKAVGIERVGGLVGANYGIMINCYSSGLAAGTERVGGLVGANYGTVTNCYSTGSVIGTDSIGGLVGSGYAAVNSFWDIQTSGQTASAGGMGRTTQQMRQAGTYIGWNSDGEVDWVIDEGKDYPCLVWEGRPGQPISTYNLTDFVTGSGTADDPYLISTTEQYNSIGCFPSQWGKQYRLVADIDLAGTEPVVIGVSYLNPFTGVLDGNGRTISNFTYDSNSMSYIGLVGYLGKGGVVKDLGLVGVHVTGYSFVGGLVGCNYYGTVSNCYSSGSVSGTDRVGGLVGYNSDGTVTNCYSSGSVLGTERIGGLVGQSYGSVINCYSSGSVSGTAYVGGLVGTGYSTEVRNSFWDVQTSGQTGSSGGTGKTVAQMQDIKTYLTAGWDFFSAGDGPSDIWAMPQGGGYPVIWWQVDPLPALPAFGGGCGTREDPYLIADANHLNQIGSNPRLMDRCFTLVKDIDLLGVNFYIIGDVDNPFMGVFEGDGHTISNLVYNAGSYYVGLFSCVGQTGEVRNLTLSNVHVTGYLYVGSLAGKNEGLVSGCQATGTVSGSSFSSYVGGLIGWNRYGTVSECSATVKTSGDLNVGDLIGRNDMPEL